MLPVRPSTGSLFLVLYLILYFLSRVEGVEGVEGVGFGGKSSNASNCDCDCDCSLCCQFRRKSSNASNCPVPLPTVDFIPSSLHSFIVSFIFSNNQFLFATEAFITLVLRLCFLSLYRAFPKTFLLILSMDCLLYTSDAAGRAI